MIRQNFYEKRLQHAALHAENVRRRREIKEAYHSNDKEKKKISSGKLFLGFLLGDFFMIQLFCMWFMLAYPEYSDFGSFIGIALAIVGQVGAVLGYFRKSTAENTVGGIVYDYAMQKMNMEDDEPVG